MMLQTKSWSEQDHLILKHGGFYITESAKNLSVRTVLEVIGESAIFTKCVLGLKNCTDRVPCPMHAQYKPIKEQLIQLFESKTIHDLAQELSSGEAFIANVKRRVGK